MGSRSCFFFTVLCLFTFSLGNNDGMNNVFPKKTRINAVDRQAKFRANVRIVGGTEAPPSTVRALARLIIIGKQVGSPDKGKACTGTVLRRRWLLTAAHCFFFGEGFRASVQDSYAFIGQADATLRISNTNIRPYRFIRYLIHKNHVSGRDPLGSDIALVFLDRPIASDTFSPVTLVSRSRIDPRPVSRVNIAGYGAVANPRVSADRAMQAPVTLQTIAECRRRAPSPNAINFDGRLFVCAVPRLNSRRENTGICFGDSGGPIFTVVNNRIVQFGVTSFITPSISCAQPNSVSFHGRVSYFYSAIIQALRMNFASWNVVNA